MQGPDFKVGKTDIIDSKGNRVVTTTTNENTLDGKSIWTIKQEFDYDNDGKMDGSTKETLTYDSNTDKLLEKTVESDNTGAFKNRVDGTRKHVSNKKYFYETATGNLVKTIGTSDWHADGKIDTKTVINYTYDSEGRVINKHTVEDDYSFARRKTIEDESNSYHKNGQLKEDSYKIDNGNDGTIDLLNEHEYDEKGRVVRLRRNFGGVNYEDIIKYNDKNGTAEMETKEFSQDGKNTLIGHKKKVVKVGKNGKFGKTLSTEDLMPKEKQQEEPAKAEEKPQYEMPSYKPYSQKSDKKHPPMMGV